MYKKISSIENNEDVEDIKDELLDRFGDVPVVVLNLIDISYIKSLARNLGIGHVKETGNKIFFYF